MNFKNDTAKCPTSKPSNSAEAYLGASVDGSASRAMTPEGDRPSWPEEKTLCILEQRFTYMSGREVDKG